MSPYIFHKKCFFFKSHLVTILEHCTFGVILDMKLLVPCHILTLVGSPTMDYDKHLPNTIHVMANLLHIVSTTAHLTIYAQKKPDQANRMSQKQATLEHS